MLEMGLSIASVAYGALLGVFSARRADAQGIRTRSDGGHGSAASESTCIYGVGTDVAIYRGMCVFGSIVTFAGWLLASVLMPSRGLVRAPGV